jgi:penicillin amidase
VAWGITGAGIDEQDTCIIRLNPDNPAQYAWEGGWREMEVIEDALAINGVDEPVPFTIYRTHLGPLIAAPSSLAERDQALAIRWTAQDSPSDPVLALLRLDRAHSWDDFRAALAEWGGAAANVLYADVEGNIGYQLAGRIPVRAPDRSGLRPVSGQDGAATWRGTVPFDALPDLYNPPRGYIITANNPVVPPGYEGVFAAQAAARFDPGASWSLAAVWDPGYRAARIEERLLETEAHTVETFADIQGDSASRFAAQLLPYLTQLEPDGTLARDMLDWLDEWDRRYALDSPQAALAGAFWQRLIEFTYTDELGVIPCDCDATRQAILDLLAVPNHPWWDDVQTRFVVERRDAILRRAFEQALIDLTARLGDSHDEWRWGDLHTATFTSVLALNVGVEFIEDQFSRGPVPVGGSADAVNATRSAASASHPFGVLSAPSARLIVDLGDLENSRAMHTTGQSNHLASPHYDDMIDPWRFIEYHNLLWGHTTIEESAVAMLSLEPVLPLEDTPDSGG